MSDLEEAYCLRVKKVWIGHPKYSPPRVRELFNTENPRLWIVKLGSG